MYEVKYSFTGVPYTPKTINYATFSQRRRIQTAQKKDPQSRQRLFQRKIKSLHSRQECCREGNEICLHPQKTEKTRFQKTLDRQDQRSRKTLRNQLLQIYRQVE